MLLMVLLLPAPGYSERAGNCPGSITSYWLLDEQGVELFPDAVGTLDAGCAGESCPASVPGRIANAVSFDGTNDGLSVSADLSLNWGASDSFSVEFWVKTDPSSTCAGNQVIAGRNENSFRWWVGCWDTSGAATFRLRDKTGAGPTDPLFSTTDITDGKWHHVAAVRDGLAGLTKIYVDGHLEGSQSYTYQSGFDSPAALLSIGWLDISPYYFFAGIIDEMAIYSRALDGTEILQHYQDGSIGLQWGYCGCGLPVKIMPLGDSITMGKNDSSNSDENYMAGYRQKLYLDLSESGYAVDFVGSQRSGSLVAPVFDIDHAGYPGYHASGGTSGDILSSVFNELWINPAEVVLLHIGTNDVSTGGQDVNEIRAILDEIDRYSPDTSVVLARIINRTDSPALAQATAQFNNEVEAMATERISYGDRILIVDQESALDYLTDMSLSGIHPNDNGYAKMADVWFKGLGEILPFCAQIPRIISVPVTAGIAGQVYTYDVDAVGYPTPSYSLVSGQQGMAIDAVSGLITWVPSLSGVFDVTVDVSNANGSARQSFSITVGESNAVRIWLEAEEGILTPPVAAAQDSQASAGGYIWVPDGRGDVFDATKAAGQARFTFTVPVSGNFVIWGRVIANNDSNNSFFVSLDDGVINAWEVAVATNWMWDQVNVKGGADPLVLSLAAGQHSLVIKQREDGAKLDRLLITNDMQYLPQWAGEPVITSAAVTAATITQQYIYDVEAAGTPSPIYRLVVFPEGMTIDEQSGLILWNPSGAGTYAVTLMAENAGGGSIQHFMITVSGAYTITATAGTGGGITPAGEVTVAQAGSQTFAIVAGTGYQISDVQIDGVSIGAVSTYTFGSITDNHTIAASFAVRTFTVTASVPGGNGTIACAPASVNYGGSSQCTITPATGYQLIKLILNDTDVTGSVSGNTFALSNITADCALSAAFAVTPVVVSAVSSGKIERGNTLKIPHTTSGTNRLMLVGVSLRPGTGNYSVKSITHNGKAMTKVGSVVRGTSARVEIWRLINPDAGTFNVTITFNRTVSYGAVAGVVTMNGVNQTTPLGAFASANGSSKNASVNVSSAADEVVFSAVDARTSGTMTQGILQTERWDIASMRGRRRCT